jgi:hypothetical protein
VLGFALLGPLRAEPPRGIAELEQEKASRTLAQQKLDSHIVLALKKIRGEPPFDKPTKLDPDLRVEQDGRVLVDLKATVSPELIAQIESAGGKILNKVPAFHAIRALVPLTHLEQLAARDDVTFIAPATQASTNSGPG